MPRLGPAMGSGALERLVQAVQTNCHVADARHAADLSLCNYLLQMREFFRWERGLPFGAALPRQAVGDWIAEREALWDAHESLGYLPLPVPLPVAGARGDAEVRAIDPFDAEAVNDALHPQGLVYGAGLIGGVRPVFFLAELHALGTREGLRVQHAGRELARGLAAPPAALAGGADGPIVLRRESMARHGWERYEAFQMRPTPGSAMAAMLQAYGFERGFDAALPRWLDEHTEMALLHELGEHAVGRRFGGAWQRMRENLPTRRAALQAAAVRDQLADFGHTLPTLLARPPRDAEALLHAWFAGYEGLREAYFPSLVGAYRHWRAGDDGCALRAAVERGAAHFEALAQRLLACQAEQGDAAGPGLAALLDRADAVCV